MSLSHRRLQWFLGIMNWNTLIKNYLAYLQLEKGLSGHSIKAYKSDIEGLARFIETEGVKKPTSVQKEDISRYLSELFTLGLSANTQARVLSGIKSFFTFLQSEEIREDNPTDLVDAPKIGRKLPDTLSFEEILELLAAIDLAKPEGHRNKAIIETLYGAGLRVSELTNLKFSDLITHEGMTFLRITGKGNKQRIAPLGEHALKEIELYKESLRNHLSIAHGHEDYIFLNRFGKAISRVSIFTIIKDLCAKAGIHKNISPHTLRHSFATHLIDGGADLRVVQQMLGHESITTTEIYTHINTQYLKDTIQSSHPLNRML